MGLVSKQYVPILKAREAEIVALRRRPSHLKVTPYFEIQNVGATPKDPATGLPKRGKSAVTDASYFLDDIARLWDGDLYLDVSRVAAPAGRERWWQLMTSLSALTPVNGVIIPALAEGDPREAWEAAAPLASLAGRAAMRISLPHSSPTSIAATLANAAADVGLPASSLDVVLDWGDQMEAEVISLDTLVSHTSTVISALGSDHGTVITAGTPNSRKFVQVGYWNPTRREWWLWLRLVGADIDIAYGDYCLYPPSDPVPARPQYGHLRYSSGDQLHVHRKAIPPSGGGLKAAFAHCCAELVASSHFLGASYSAADAQLEEIALGAAECGSAGLWRQNAAIHHFALVADQLASPPAPPSTGTP
ncbi:beta family protein [Brachybacterium epidermidis]|uniref:beta family protein n=1 Tax=Brachybacterium epidermidis TaxID=2781983 RepID=UPI00398F2C98